MSAGADERVGRVGRSVAVASANLIAATSKARESGRHLAGALDPPFGVPLALGGLVPAAAGSAPSAPELAHAHTSPMHDARAARPTRNGLVLAMAAVATLALAGGIIAAVLVGRGREREATGPSAGVASTTSVQLDLPPVIDPPPPPTYRPTDEPQSVTSSPASAAVTPPPVVAKRAGDAGMRTAAPPSASAAPADVKTAEPPKAAATASSRFD
jgi:hypothetical protein